jgi:TolB-like protein
MILAIAFGLLIIIGGVYAGYRLSRSSASSPLDVTLGHPTGRKTVAVMYLNNQSNTASLEWLREGLADMLINNLSRSKKLAVLKREQLHLLLERSGYKPSDEITLENAMEIGRRSNAEVVVRGSFAQLERSIRLDCNSMM